MHTTTLRRSGESLIVTIPKYYIEQNHLDAGSQLSVEIAGHELKLKPARRRPHLAELLEATPPGKQRVEDWDEIPAAGNEL
jgi:antitoxin ChpS